MARDETDDTLPSQDVAKEFYAKYEPKEILGRCVHACPKIVHILSPLIHFKHCHTFLILEV
jgi:hypothetical protein